MKPRTTECPQGHEYTEENTYIHYQGKKRNKHCRKCMYARRNKLAKNKAIKDQLISTFGEVEGLRQYEELRKKK